ncbi:MAG TPA: hypothetical protein VHB73_02170, partial [Alphaproteobacteria bacterium]|nr:hypothetical protein [Alphaproteobacteria bacterium]
MTKTMVAKNKPVQTNKASPLPQEVPPLKARIVILSPDLSNTSTGRMALDLALRIRAEGGVPLVAAPGGILKLELQRQKIGHKILPDPNASALSHMMASFQFSGWMGEQRPRFVHVLDFSLARLAYEAMLKNRVPMALSLNQPVISALSSRDGGTLRSFERILVPSSFAREQLLQQLQLPERAVQAVIPGINLNVVHYNRIGPQKIMSLEKNWQLPDDQPLVVVPDCPLDPIIFDAMAASLQELKKKNVYTVLFVPAPERTATLQRVDRMGLTSHVITVSNMADRIPALWLAHTVLVTGFRGQDSLLALIEAQAMGRPV